MLSDGLGSTSQSAFRPDVLLAEPLDVAVMAPLCIVTHRSCYVDVWCHGSLFPDGVPCDQCWQVTNTGLRFHLLLANAINIGEMIGLLPTV